MSTNSDTTDQAIAIATEVRHDDAYANTSWTRAVSLVQSMHAARHGEEITQRCAMGALHEAMKQPTRRRPSAGKAADVIDKALSEHYAVLTEADRLSLSGAAMVLREVAEGKRYRETEAIR